MAATYRYEAQHTCNLLYRTLPGPPWDDGDLLACTDVGPRQRELVARTLAVHAPSQPYESAHRVQSVWGAWVDGYTPVARPDTTCTNVNK
jgi:hypothetical protein